MTAPQFVHLRLHSEYSVADGIVRIDDAVDAAAADEMPALALTDLNNLFGLVKFYKAARAKGLKPVIGCDAWLANEADRDQPFRILLLCQSRSGYLKLCEWLSRAYRGNQYRGRAELSREWLAGDTSGLIALSGAAAGDVGQALVLGNPEQAEAHARWWQAHFPDRYYLELQRTGRVAEEVLQQTLALAGILSLPTVATHPIQFLKRDGFKAHEARVCIAEGYVLADQRRPKPHTTEQYFKTRAEMAELFGEWPEALSNSVEIAKRCNLAITLGKNFLPVFPTPAGVSLDDHLKSEAQAGLVRRMEGLYPDPAAREGKRAQYEARLEFEVKTIVQMGFSGYFLIVADFINWAKSNGVPVGPGRGSGAGSLVAYSLGITDLDPLAYNLLFERFLNPERVSMPDFDVDFCQDGRDRVIEYVRRKYGEDCVAQIATFGTMAAKAVVRDVGRVLDLPYSFCDGIAKLIPFQPGKLITLKMAREMEPQLAERERKEEEVAELLELAEHLEGMTRNVGMHAGGVLIAPGKLTDFCPLYAQSGAEGVVSQFDKDDVEAVGLVKFDFLGLTTLTILDWAVKHIRALYAEHGDFDIARIPLDDRGAFEVLKRADTVAIFQLESRGMRDMIVKARPDRFEDIIALVALYRPGPMDLIPSFIDRKHGRERVEYLDPRLEPILGETYGIMVYQEQVMQIAQVIGGYTLGGADLLRRAMGKKKPEEMAKHRGIFREGAQNNGLSGPKADELFDLMEKFAGYGFNKSHAAAYALLAYQTAFLKAHFPAEFAAANLSAAMDDTDKVQVLYNDAKAAGLTVLAPDINASGYRFEPVRGPGEPRAKTLHYGLGAIKGTGEAAIADIVRARQRGGPFRGLFDFCQRVDKRLVNRRVIEALVKAGAFDALEANRASLFASVGMAMEHAEQLERNASQHGLFGDDATPVLKLAAVRAWPELEQLQNEKSTLGFYLSGHPFHAYRDDLGHFVKLRLADLRQARDSVVLAGIVTQLRVQMTRRGRMAFITLDDGSAQIEVSVFNEVFEASRAWLKEDALVVVNGKASEDSFSGGLRVVAETLHDLRGARDAYARGLRLACNGGSNAGRLQEVLTPYRSGPCPVTIDYSNGIARGEVSLGDAWRVTLHDQLLARLRDWLQPENVQIIY
jgi:DNA polymerase-3 subunit alpha